MFIRARIHNQHAAASIMAPVSQMENRVIVDTLKFKTKMVVYVSGISGVTYFWQFLVYDKCELHIRNR